MTKDLKAVSDRSDNTMWKGHTDNGKAIYIEKRHTGGGGWRYFIYVQNRPFGEGKGYAHFTTAEKAALGADAL